MALHVVKYGHPVLRQKGAAIPTITPEVRGLIEAMFEAMYAAKGVGLAAQQVGHALQLCVIDIRGSERPSTAEVDGHPVDPSSLMPLALVNPKLKPFGAEVDGAEGCLSFPEIYSDITRPEGVEVEALNQHGQTVRFKAWGLLSRAIQHENDHLNGILFIDRMTQDDRKEHKPEIDALHAETKAKLKKK